MSTNYRNAFIKVATDYPGDRAIEPTKEGSIAALQLAMLRERPYAMTSDDLLFEVHAARTGVPAAEREAASTAFFARSQACLRASPLVKTFGWGLHHDAQARIAAYAIESADYAALLARPGLEIVPGMRSKRA